MAGKQTLEVFSVLMPISAICWDPANNIARLGSHCDYGDDKEKLAIRGLLAQHGWLQADNGVIQVEAVTPHYQEREMVRRQSKWDDLKQLTKTEVKYSAKLQVFEEMYTDGKGKLLAPTHIGDTGNRRGSELFNAMCDRREANLPISTHIPVIIRSFKSDMDRLEAIVQENELRNAGNKEMTNIDRLYVGLKTYEFGKTEADLTRILGNKRGMAQKVWAIVKLDKQNPGVKIIERMMLPPTDQKFITWNVDKELMRGLWLRGDAAELAEENKKRATKGDEALKSATSADVEAYFSAPKTADANATKMISKDAVKGLAKQFPAKVVADTFRAMENNNVDPLEIYRVNATGLNAHAELLVQNEGPPLALLLVKLLQVPADKRQAVMKAMTDLCGK